MVTTATKKLRLVKSTESFKILVPREVENTIRHLCSVVHDVEWSGTLFYTYKGSIENKDLEITCVDLFVMDIGTGGATDFNESPAILNYRVEHDLLGGDIMEGLIHSHNNMSTFFSSTDLNTLVQEGTNCNHFVSLIVNNEGTYTAGITRKIVKETKAQISATYTENSYYDSFKGATVELTKDEVKHENKEEVTKEEYIEWFNLDVTVERSRNSFRELDARLSEIRKSKSKNVKSYKSYTSPYYQKTTVTSSPTKQKSLWEDYYDDYPFYEPLEDPVKDMTTTKNIDKKEMENISFNRDLIEDIAVQLLTGSIMVNKDTINIKDWAANMESVYKKRFGSIDKTNKRLNDWLESMLEFLLYTEDKELDDKLLISDYYYLDSSEVCAMSLLDYLDELPSNKVLDIITNILYTKYISYDVE